MARSDASLSLLISRHEPDLVGAERIEAVHFCLSGFGVTAFAVPCAGPDHPPRAPRESIKQLCCAILRDGIKQRR
ncbi:hypothetical protein [Pseudogemmobacter sonorensis]|uniref:hypothetical protein n=1 Tax=Pseudogemmobacter sonorensis TaxID=2989681 RepID=UPI0036C99D46